MNSEEVAVSASRMIEIIVVLEKCCLEIRKTVGIPNFLIKSCNPTRTKKERKPMAYHHALAGISSAEGCIIFRNDAIQDFVLIALQNNGIIC